MFYRRIKYKFELNHEGPSVVGLVPYYRAFFGDEQTQAFTDYIFEALTVTSPIKCSKG